MTQEKRKIPRNLKKPELKKRLSKIKWRSDHRGIKYNPKTGVVTVT